jgi:valyl-tRNA synthetase
MDEMQEITRRIRNIRAEMNVPEKAELECRISVKDEAAKALVLEHAPWISHLARLSGLTAGVDLEKPAGAATQVVGGLEVYVLLGDVIDVDAEIARLRKESEKMEGQVRGCERKLQNRDFLEKAPEEIVEREKERRDDLAARLEAIQGHIASLMDLRA